MSAPLIIVVGLIYFLISADQFLRGSVPLAVVFFGYALANVGMLFAVR